MTLAVPFDWAEAVKAAAIFVFFFSIGIELRHEIKHGSLSKSRQAIVPIFAAVGGMLIPVVIYSIVNAGLPSAAGWGVPMSTDVAFALAVLNLAGRFLPKSIRVFLLTVAVVDDSLTILIIAIFFASSFQPLSVFSLAGVALGLLLPRGQRIAGRLTPIANFAALPVFAAISLWQTFAHFQGQLAGSAITLGVIGAMVFGKPIGVLGATWLVTKSGLGKLANDVKWPDLFSIASLFGICFTVAMMMSELSFVAQPSQHSIANVSVLIGSFTSASLAVVALRIRKRAHV
jgi:NhaA family Na+:H+ antiporter